MVSHSAKDSTPSQILVVVVGGILLLIFTHNFNETQALPSAALAVDQYNKFCPTTLYFGRNGDEISSFSVGFKNVGDDDGVLYMTLFSDKDTILSRNDNLNIFTTNTTYPLTVEINQKDATYFKFEIKLNENSAQRDKFSNILYLDNFTMSFDYGCYKIVNEQVIPCKQYPRQCCSYQQDPGYTSYKLVKQSC